MEKWGLGGRFSREPLLLVLFVYLPVYSSVQPSFRPPTTHHPPPARPPTRRAGAGRAAAWTTWPWGAAVRAVLPVGRVLGARLSPRVCPPCSPLRSGASAGRGWAARARAGAAGALLSPEARAGGTWGWGQGREGSSCAHLISFVNGDADETWR